MKSLPHHNGDGSGAATPDRMPPYNIEAERGVLGSCLLGCERIDECAEILRPEDFYRSDHGETWTVMVELRDAGQEVDAVTLAEALIRRDLFRKFGGDEFLRSLVEAVPHAANAKYYAGIVRELAIGRDLLNASAETLREIYNHQHTASDLICNAEERIFAVGERDAGNTYDAEAFVGEAMVRLGMRREGAGVTGLATGYEDVDGMTGGFHPGSLVILAARPSQGKSAYASDIMCRVTARNEPVLFISLEMGRGELADRMLASLSGVDGYLIREAQLLNPRQHQELHRAAARLSRMPFRIDDTAGKTVSQIAAQARRTKRRYGLSLLVIDYLGLINGVRQKGESRQEEVARISRGLKTLARNLNIPILALHQLNRKSEERDGRRPMLADLRDSGQLEADADLVLLLHRPEFYDANDQPGVAELFIAKNRNGATGTIRLSFQKQCTRFDSFSQSVPDAIPEGSPF